MLQLLHWFEHKGKRYSFYLDELHETVGSYAYDTPEETKAAEDEEIEKIARGEWVAVACVVEEKCEGILPTDGQALHCACCKAKGPWVQTDSLWGIVLDNSPKAMEQYVIDGGI